MREAAHAFSASAGDMNKALSELFEEVVVHPFQAEARQSQLVIAHRYRVAKSKEKEDLSIWTGPRSFSSESAERR